MRRVEANSSVTLVWNAEEVLNLEVPSGARVTSIRVVEADTPSPLHQHRIILRENATFEHLDLLLGNEDSSWNVTFMGERSRAHIYGVHGVSSGRTARSHVVMNHAAPRCKSYQYFKCVAAEGGTSQFRSRVIVRENATDSDAHQTNRNLLLGNGSHCVSEPELEIYTDAVKCSHGSTTGRLDDSALFYLRSRGIDEKRARTMLVQAFARDLLDSLPGAQSAEKVAWAKSRWEAWAQKGLPGLQ